MSDVWEYFDKRNNDVNIKWKLCVIEPKYFISCLLHSDTVILTARPSRSLRSPYIYITIIKKKNLFRLFVIFNSVYRLTERDYWFRTNLLHLSRSWQTTHGSFILVLRGRSLHVLTNCNLHCILLLLTTCCIVFSSWSALFRATLTAWQETDFWPLNHCTPHYYPQLMVVLPLIPDIAPFLPVVSLFPPLSCCLPVNSAQTPTVLIIMNTPAIWANCPPKTTIFAQNTYLAKIHYLCSDEYHIVILPHT